VRIRFVYHSWRWVGGRKLSDVCRDVDTLVAASVVAPLRARELRSAIEHAVVGGAPIVHANSTTRPKC
jgi:hypothetical protein